MDLKQLSGGRIGFVFTESIIERPLLGDYSKIYYKFFENTAPYEIKIDRQKTINYNVVKVLENKLIGELLTSHIADIYNYFKYTFYDNPIDYQTPHDNDLFEIEFDKLYFKGDLNAKPVIKSIYNIFLTSVDLRGQYM